MIDYVAPRPAGARPMGVESGASRERIEALMPPPPATLHAIGSMTVDGVGNLWVRRA
jgi:hypothetical protein